MKSQSAILDISRDEGNSATRQSVSSNLVNNWGKYNPNKSAIVKGSKSTLPEKLLKMKERVKRDRSANLSQIEECQTGAAGTLYGRKKLTESLDRETQKLRESYSQHRRPTSKSFVGSRKQNFKEDPFDDQGEDQVLRDRSMDQNLLLRGLSDKENVLRESQAISLTNQSQSAQNRYKRSQMRSNQALANYQQKYERLEKNFKKFTNNIRHATQSEQIIDNLKFKTGLSIVVQMCKKADNKDQRRAVKIWRLNSGVAQKSFENQEKTLILAKCAQKMHQRSLNHVKIQYYQKWKRLSLASDGGVSGPDRVMSKLSEIMTNTEDFNKCIENDFYLSQIVNEKLQQVIGGLVASDILFDEGEEMKSYHFETGEHISFSVKALMNFSILGQTLRNRKGGITVTERISTNANFNKEVDMPINQDQIQRVNKSESNAFNKIRGLSMVMVPLEIGVLRLYFNSINAEVVSPTPFQMRQIVIISKVLPNFLQRIFDVRTQVNSLAQSNMEQAQQISLLESYNEINQNVREFHEKIIKESLPQDETMNMIKNQVEDFLKGYFDFENLVLRQVLLQRQESRDDLEQLLPSNSKDLMRFNDHVQENQEAIEDFLDYKKEYYVHQISICPKVLGQQRYQNCTFILQIYNKYQNVENLRDLRDLSTSVNSYTNISQRLGQGEKKYLTDDIKHKLVFYFRSLTPLIQSAISVTGDLNPKIERLEADLKINQKKYDSQQFLHNVVNTHKLIEEPSDIMLSLKLTEGLTQAMVEIAHQTAEIQDNSVFGLYNTFTFHRNQIQGNFQFQGYLYEEHLQTFGELFKTYRNKFEVMAVEDSEITQINVSQDILPTQMQVSSNATGCYDVILPISSSSHQNHLLVVLIFSVKNQDGLENLQQFSQEAQSFLVDLIQKRQVYHQLQDKHDKLLEKLQGEKLTQGARDLIDEALIIPYIKYQSLKALGDGIDSLCDKLVQNAVTDEEWEYGQEISQIAYLGPKVYIEDVRLLQSYSQSESFAQPDQMMLESFKQKQQLVYEDEVLEKVIILYPIVSTQHLNYSQGLRQPGTAVPESTSPCLLLRFVIDRDHNVQRKLENIHQQLLIYIQPIVSSALQNGQVFTRQHLALEKLANVIDRYRFGSYREIIYFMRDLKAKNVYNFSRSRLYEKILKSRRYYELKQTDESAEQYFDISDKNLSQNQLIQHLIRQSVKTMNKHAFRYKLSCFKRFVVGTRKQVYPELSKKKKRAICTLMNHYSNVNLREFFSRFAINSKCFRHIKNIKSKYLASANCLFRNFRIVRERLAFLKLKKNLNLYLKDSMTAYQEKDKDLFIQLNQILISSHQQQGGLEGGFQYAMSEIFNYLRNLSSQELHMKDVGNLAHDGFVGHIDEAVLTMKSHVHISQAQGNSVNLNSSQKTRIFVSTFSDPSLSASQTMQRGKALRLSYDSNLGISQQDQILNQINASNVDNNFENESQDLENQFANNYQKYTILQKRDLINQMLVKSNGIIFNFQNIQQSLSDIFLNQQSHHKDQNIGNRFAIVRRSKSALIMPLFDVSQQTIIGSLELYRHHQQAFTEEIEARYDFFSKRLADFFLIYGQLKAQLYQIEQLKWQVQKSVKPSLSLSGLLKNVFVNAPGNHFPGANHVLPIIILNQTQYMQDWDDYDEPFQIPVNKKLAFFYQFKDNHIYNFDFEGTFIDELMENGCILEMCQKGMMNQDEGLQESHRTHKSNHQLQSIRSDRQSDRSGAHSFRHKSVMSDAEKVKSVTNEQFKHIIYYPVFDVQDDQKIVAVLEVGFKRRDTTQMLLTDEIQQYLDSFRSSLSQYTLRLKSFSRNLENIFIKQQNKSLVKKFQHWKQCMVFLQYRDNFEKEHVNVLQNQEMCYSEYMQNLDEYQAQLKSSNEENRYMKEQIEQFTNEKRAKLKFLATSLVSSQNLFKKMQQNKIKQAFIKWQYNVSIRKIAEAAFSRVLELNHKHSKARFKTGIFLLQNVMEEYALQDSFNNILQAAHMRRNEWAGRQANSEEFITRSRSRSKGNNSFVLNNITSLLSPANLRKIERQNLYQKQIGSFYTPGGAPNASESTLVAAPIQQPSQVHETSRVIRNKSQSKGRVSNDMSRFSRYQTNANTQMGADYTRDSKQNPYSELDISQIEYTQKRRDYSPIITTTKYDLKKIYDPQGAMSSMEPKHQTIIDDVRSQSYMTRQAPKTSSDPGLGKKARSVENFRRRGSAITPVVQTTKAELQKQLCIKQKQLTVMKQAWKTLEKQQQQQKCIKKAIARPASRGSKRPTNNLSPPVRLQSKVEEDPEAEARKKAQYNVITALHQKYDQLSQ